ncbi:hypothetical protein GCM10027395_00780 [Giesbergeria sinuosa]
MGMGLCAKAKPYTPGHSGGAALHKLVMQPAGSLSQVLCVWRAFGEGAQGKYLKQTWEYGPE